MALARGLIGFDLSDLVLRAATVNPRRQQPALTAFQEMLLPPGFIRDGEILQPRPVADRIRLLLQHAHPNPIRERFVVASLPDRKTFIKLIRLPLTPKEKIPATLEQTMAQHIPFAPEDIYFDWQEMPSVDAGATMVLVGAAPKSLVESYLATLEEAGLTVVALEMESLALIRALYADKIPQPAALLVDIGGSRTTVVATGQGALQFSSSLPFSGANFTQSLATVLRLSQEEAELLKQSSGFTSKTKASIVRAFASPLETLAKHITDIVNFFVNHFPESGPIRSIVLSGGGAQLTGIDQALAAQTHYPVRVGVTRVMIPKRLAFPPFRLPSFSTAIGLALHRL